MAKPRNTESDVVIDTEGNEEIGREDVRGENLKQATDPSYGKTDTDQGYHTHTSTRAYAASLDYGKFATANANLEALEANLAYLAADAVTTNNPMADRLVQILAFARTAKGNIADVQVAVGADLDSLARQYDDIQVAVGRLASATYSVRTNLR